MAGKPKHYGLWKRTWQGITGALFSGAKERQELIEFLDEASEEMRRTIEESKKVREESAKERAESAKMLEQENAELQAALRRFSTGAFTPKETRAASTPPLMPTPEPGKKFG